MIISKISEFVKRYQADIILVVGVILISLLSFATGFLVAKEQEKEPIKIEYDHSNNWRGNQWALSRLEIS